MTLRENFDETAVLSYFLTNSYKERAIWRKEGRIMSAGSMHKFCLLTLPSICGFSSDIGRYIQTVGGPSDADRQCLHAQPDRTASSTI